MPIIKCDECGKEFNQFQSRINNNKHNFCCKECRLKYNSNNVELICDYCGEKYIQYGSRLNYNKHFCSNECKINYQTRNTKLIKCPQCGKEFKRNQSDYIKYKNVFCSRECADLFQRKKNNIVIKDNHAEIIFNKNGKEIVGLIDIEDIEKINNVKWGLHYAKSMNSYYVVSIERVNYNPRKYLKLHRIVTNCPDKMVVDHINHNTLDNRKSNLRICTNQENCENRNGAYITNKSTGYRNIGFKNGKYTVCITKNQKRINGGYFDKLEDAIIAAKNLRNEYFSIKEL